jgi:hypothetical protein
MGHRSEKGKKNCVSTGPESPIFAHAAKLWRLAQPGRLLFEAWAKIIFTLVTNTDEQTLSFLVLTLPCWPPLQHCGAALAVPKEIHATEGPKCLIY